MNLRRNKVLIAITAITIILIMILGYFNIQNSTIKLAKTEESEPKAAEYDGISKTTKPAGYTAITTAAEFVNIKNNLGGKYILMNDIDLSTTSFNGFGIFSGILDGNYHTIKNMSINSEGLLFDDYNCRNRNVLLDKKRWRS